MYCLWVQPKGAGCGRAFPLRVHVVRKTVRCVSVYGKKIILVRVQMWLRFSVATAGGKKRVRCVSVYGKKIILVRVQVVAV